MSIDEKSLKAFSDLDQALSSRARTLDVKDLCKMYSDARPAIILALRIIERIPGYGKAIADTIRFLMELADKACGVPTASAATEGDDHPKLDRGKGMNLLANATMAYVTWTYPSDIRRGDCTIRAGATFYLYEDGSTRWVCDIASSDSGDEWDGDFFCTNAGGVRLWADHYHFDISDDNVWKRWDESRGANGPRAASFHEVQGLSFSCSC